MKKIIVLFFVFVTLVQTSLAQTKILTMEEAVVKQRTTLAPGKLKQLMWVKNTNTYSFIDTRNTEEVLVIANVSNTKLIDAVTLIQFNSSLAKASLEEIKSFPVMTWENEKQFSFINKKQYVAFNIDSKTIKILRTEDFGDGSENKDIASKTNYLAYTVKNNLFVFV